MILVILVSLLEKWSFFSFKETILGQTFATSQLVAQSVGSFRGLGQVALGCGQLEKAKEQLQTALAIHQEVQDREGVGVVLFRFAHLAELQGDLDSAEKQYQASLDIFYAAQLDRLIPNTLLEFGRFLIERRGKREEGCSMLLQAAQRYGRM